MTSSQKLARIRREGRKMDVFSIPQNKSLNQAKILVGLAEVDEPLSHAVIADWLGLARASITQIADAIVNNGMAERDSCPKDRRVRLLKITDKGREFVKGLTE